MQNVDVLSNVPSAEIVAQQTDNNRLRHHELNQRHAALLDQYERTLSVFEQRVKGFVESTEACEKSPFAPAGTWINHSAGVR